MLNAHKKVVFHLKEGTLHTALHVAQGKKIPLGMEQKKLAAAKADGNVTLEKKIVFALNARHFKKK